MENDYRKITDAEIEQFIPYLRGHIARKYPAFGEKEELFSAGLEGAAEGIRRYDPSRKAPYEYWVQRYAAHYIQNRWRALRNKQTGVNTVPADSVPAPGADPSAELETRELAGIALSVLAPVERRVVEGIYWKGLSLRALAKVMNVNVDAVFRLHRNALKKMKERMGPDGE